MFTTDQIDHLRGHDFFPSQEVLSEIPGLKESKRFPKQERMIYLHFHTRYENWLVAELDPSAMTAWGYVSGDLEAAGWRTFSLNKLSVFLDRQVMDVSFVTDQPGPNYARAVQHEYPVERDLNWTPRPFSECE